MEGAKRLAAKSEACSRVPATQPKAAGRATTDVHQAFCAALSTLPYPTSRWPSAGEGRIYTAWQELLENPVVYASNQVRRMEHMVQVSVYSEQPLTAMELEKVRHPAPLVESAAMAAVRMPPATYKPNLPAELIKSGGISAAQLENVVYAGQAHEQMLPDGKRKGYFIGDGTGVGKGRQIGAIILDNMRQGRKKAVWVSKNLELLPDAQRDWVDIGGSKEQVVSHQKFKTGASIDLSEGILFTGYSTLKNEIRGQSRLQQVIDWLGKDFDGVIALDEVHQASNLTGKASNRGKTKPAKVALTVADLQNALPNARVVYVSATGATDVNELAYAQRLGLWGKGTAFRDVNDFIEQIGSSGISAMELVARDMKAMGVYLARSISYDGIQYDTLQHTLDPMQTQIYDTMSEAWQVTLQNMNEALNITKTTLNYTERGHARSQYFQAMQRFYNQVLTSMGMPSVIADIHKELNAGHSIVLQIVNTNKAEQDRQLAAMRKSGGELEELDLTPRGTLLEYLEKSFPIYAYEEYTNENGKVLSRPVLDAAGKQVIDREAQRLRDELVARVKEMSIPDGPLEMLFDAFGTEMVAEVTGRNRRVVPKKNERGETVRVEESCSPRHTQADVEAFQNGDKRILVFSDAGGTGKSYHADLPAKNQQKRVHYLIQPGWSASKATQGFGRTHRSNQAQPPQFKLVTTNAMGQKRFVSTIARRLDQLGALTKGQRETGSGMFGAKDNLESSLAKDSLRTFYEQLGHNRIEGLDGDAILKKLDLYDTFTDEYGRFRLDDVEARNMNTFLNRILALGIEEQNRVFGAFYDIFETAYDHALQNGTLDLGMETVKADKIEIVDNQVIRTDQETGATTNYVQAKVYRKPMVMRTIPQLEKARRNFAGLYQTDKGEVRGVFRIADKTMSDGKIHKMYRVQSPLHGKFGTWSDTTLAERAKLLPKKDWNTAWAQEVAKQPEYEESTTHMLTGTLLPIWNLLPKEGNTRAMRIIADDGTQYLGRVIAPTQIDSVLNRLGAAERTKEQYTPADVMKKVLAGSQARLMNDRLALKRSRVSGEYRIEVTGQNLWYLPKQHSGIIVEKINYQDRYFIPTGESGIQVMADLIKHNPVAEVTAGNDVEYRRVGKPVKAKGYNEALDWYTAHELENWAGTKKLLFYKSQEQFARFIDDAYASGRYQKKMLFGKIGKKLADRIMLATGVDVLGYNCALHADEIRKVNTYHGRISTEAPRGQRPITKIEFLLVPEVMTVPDSITLSEKDEDGNPVIEFRKDIDGIVTVVAFASKKRDLRLKTMYASKSKGSLPTKGGAASLPGNLAAGPGGSPEGSFPHTSETRSGTASLPGSLAGVPGGIPEGPVPLTSETRTGIASDNSIPKPSDSVNEPML